MKKLPVSPDPLLQFQLSMFALLTWLSVMRPLPADSILTIGIIELAMGIGCFVGSILNLERGDPNGNIQLILSVILGFAGGINQIVMAASRIWNFPFHPWVWSFILLMGGLYSACFIPLLKSKPLYVMGEHICVCIGFLCNGTSDLASLPVLKTIGCWFLFVFALLSLYQGVSMMYMLAGKHLPQGPSLSRKENQ